MAAFPPAAIAAPPNAALPADNFTPITVGVAFGEAAIAGETQTGGAGFVFDGTQWKPLR